jgi:chemotaxis protein MotB
MGLPRHLASAQGDNGDHWPGFVDALATLLLVVIVVLAVFITGQLALSQALTGRDEQLADLNARLATLAEELNIAQSENEQLNLRISGLESERDELVAQNDALSEQITGLQEGLAAATTSLETEQLINMEAMATISLLNNQMAALRNELGRLNEALNASEEREAELEAEVVNLGRRLNAALASEVARLAAYRSDFFGRLMEILGNRSGVSVVGDRFVFETDILFESGSADLSPDGMVSLQPIAAAINQLVTEIPTDLDWVIRVDGHTDRVPLGPSLPFESNWELSTARSLSVINYFESQGVPPQRLLAAGFGEHYPISNGRTAADYARNRRIELKLTDR